MKRILYAILSLLMAANAWGQGCDALEQLRMDPKKAYGGDYPYLFAPSKLTKSPKGYRPFYISHYARHGSRYYWNSRLYNELDTMLTEAHGRHILTEEGEKFYQNFLSAILSRNWFQSMRRTGLTSNTENPSGPKLFPDFSPPPRIIPSIPNGLRAI